MKKKIIIITGILIMVSILINFNLKAEPPEDLKNFIENTNNDYYWTVDATPNSLSLLIHNKKHYKSYSVGLYETGVKEQKQLKEKLYKVNVNNSQFKNSIISWRRFGDKNNPIVGPERYETVPYTAYNTKDYYNPITNKPAISLNRISDYKKINSETFNNWITYSASYNLKGAQGGLPIEMENYQGKMLLTINESHDKMNEIYISNGKWVYIRHVQKGEYPGTINDESLDNILEDIWWNWENIINPLKEKIENMDIK